jgi:hypothetical protein
VIKVVLNRNGTVVWLNEDSVATSVTSDHYFFDSGLIRPNQTWSYIFKETGVYSYHSEPHPWMSGAVLVLNDNSRSLEFWWNSCAKGYPKGTSLCQSVPYSNKTSTPTPIKLESPRKFQMSLITKNVITLYSHYYAAHMNVGNRVLFSIDSSAPINFNLVFVDKEEINIDGLPSEVSEHGKTVLERQQITLLANELDVEKSGFYIFVFRVEEPYPAAWVTLEAYLE